MHSFALVEIPVEATDVEAAVALAMGPHCMVGSEGEFIETGLWDWYRIGGRWAGLLGEGLGDVCLRSQIGDERKPSTLITLAGGLFESEHWTGTAFEDTSGELDAAWRSLDQGARLVVVDYHS